MTITTYEIPEHLSHSQVSSLSKCGAQWFYERGLHLEARPSWASAAGSAFHAATDDWDHHLLDTGEAVTDTDHLRSWWEQHFDEEIEKVSRRAPNFPPEEWRASGRASKAWPNKEDRAWWDYHGPSFLATYATWRANSAWELAEIDGEPAIEVPLEFDLAGNTVRGYIDRVFRDSQGNVIVDDTKTGSRAPDSGDQLGVYGIGLLKQYGVKADWGVYWMARTGGTTAPEALAPWTEERLGYRFSAARRLQQEGLFFHKPSTMCSACGVRRFCPEVGGEQAAEIPQPWEVAPPQA